MFYHASNVAGIQTLIPHASGHEKPLVYFSTKKENTLVYLSNPVERYCREIGFEFLRNEIIARFKGCTWQR